MKKILAFLMTVTLAVSAFSMVASAENESAETSGAVTGVVATDSSKTNLKINIKKPSKSNSDKMTSEVQKLEKQDNKSYTILDTQELTLEKVGDLTGTNDELTDKVKFPVNLSFNVLGVTAKDSGFFLLMAADGTVEKITATFADGVMTGSFSKLGTVAFVINKKAAADTEGTKAPQTSDSTTPIVLALLFAALAVAGYSVKKIRTEA